MFEEGGAFGWIVTELVAEHPKGAWGVGETAGDLDRGSLLNEEGAEGLVLAVERSFWSHEETSLG